MQNGKITRYALQIKDSSGFVRKIWRHTSKRIQGSLSYRMQGLKPHTYHIVKISACNAAGVGNHSTILFYTKEGKLNSVSLHGLT